MLLELAPWLIAMLALIACSAFFSASEAALFYLRWPDRKRLAEGTASQQLAARLLNDPDRLLSGVLFCNLVVNMLYFAITSIAGLQIERAGEGSRSLSIGFSTFSVLVVIVMAEMVPKSLAVLRAYWLAGLVARPLALAVRLVDPVMPALRTANVLSQRLVWPGFSKEPYMEVSDLERAIELSTTDADLIEQERLVLRNIVLLSEIRVDEWMRPRTRFLAFRPPVSVDDLDGRRPASGYLLVTEPDSEEVAGAIPLRDLARLPRFDLQKFAEPVLIVPWCATVADVLEKMVAQRRRVTVVVNEFGETIGILTLEDVLDTIFSYGPSRSGRPTETRSILQVSDTLWHVTGMTSLRRLGRYFNTDVPPSRSVTVAGVIQESLQRLPELNDECDWGPFHLRVLDPSDRGRMLVELTRPIREEQDK
ncbi:MAG: HlyC/CorC family transporter [Planctomycetales bacterium]|nr:HlyC/CorC family transporter [Planctomycetales bacterium]